MSIPDQNALKIALDLHPDGVALFDADQRICFANKSFLAMFGDFANSAELVGMSEADFCTLLTQHGRLHARSRLSQRFSLNSPAARAFELSYQTDPVSAMRLLWARDISASLERQAQTRDFFSMAAHQLRTPVASIFGFSELLLARKPDATRTEDLLKVIHRQSSFLVDLLGSLLELSRVSAHQTQAVPLVPMSSAQLVADSVASLPSAAAVRIQTPATDHATKVLADPVTARLAFIQVLNNALRFSAADAPVIVACQTTATHLELLISDSGPGMTREQLDRAFDHFYRANPEGSTPGAGLGLSLVRAVMQQHEGHVKLESTLDKGTCVTLGFRLAP